MEYLNQHGFHLVSQISERIVYVRRSVNSPKLINENKKFSLNFVFVNETDMKRNKVLGDCLQLPINIIQIIFITL